MCVFFASRVEKENEKRIALCIHFKKKKKNPPNQSPGAGEGPPINPDAVLNKLMGFVPSVTMYP